MGQRPINTVGNVVCIAVGRVPNGDRELTKSKENKIKLNVAKYGDV